MKHPKLCDPPGNARVEIRNPATQTERSKAGMPIDGSERPDRAEDRNDGDFV